MAEEGEESTVKEWQVATASVRSILLKKISLSKDRESKEADLGAVGRKSFLNNEIQYECFYCHPVPSNSSQVFSASGRQLGLADSFSFEHTPFTPETFR